MSAAPGKAGSGSRDATEVCPKSPFRRRFRSHRRPLHPYIVHFPLSFFVTTQALDILYGLNTNPSTSALVQSIYDARPFLTDIARMSHTLNILGLLSAIPATVAGGIQLLKLMEQQDVSGKLNKAAGSSDGKLGVVKRLHPKLKMAFVHAILNDIVIAGATWNWYSRRGNVMNAPSGLNVLVSAITAPILGFAVYLGGKMVFDYGVGVNLRGYWSSKEEWGAWKKARDTIRLGRRHSAGMRNEENE